MHQRMFILVIVEGLNASDRSAIGRVVTGHAPAVGLVFFWITICAPLLLLRGFHYSRSIHHCSTANRAPE